VIPFPQFEYGRTARAASGVVLIVAVLAVILS
jgi:hypothetical protein